MNIEIEKITDKVPRKMVAVLIGMWLLAQTAANPEITDWKVKVATVGCQAGILAAGVYLHYKKESNGNGGTT